MIVRVKWKGMSSLYFGNDTRCGVNEKRIGNRMRFIEWCHSQWRRQGGGAAGAATVTLTVNESVGSETLF